jgi:hypothetical protein
MESSELGFLNSRSTNHRVTQSKARREESSIGPATVEIPASERRCRHLLSQPNISGQELFSSILKRTTAHAKQELESNNNLSLRNTARALTASTVREDVQVVETQFTKDTKVSEPKVTKISVLQTETQHNQKIENKNVQSESKQERENPSKELTLIEREHFVPCAAIDLKRRSSFPIVITKDWTPCQDSVSSVIPHQGSSTVGGTCKSSASTPDCCKSCVKNRKSYSDVLKRETTTAPIAAVSSRYEELEQQDNRSDSLQQKQQQWKAKGGSLQMYEVTVNYYYSQFTSWVVQTFMPILCWISYKELSVYAYLIQGTLHTLVILPSRLSGIHCYYTDESSSSSSIHYISFNSKICSLCFRFPSPKHNYLHILLYVAPSSVSAWSVIHCLHPHIHHFCVFHFFGFLLVLILRSSPASSSSSSPASYGCNHRHHCHHNIVVIIINVINNSL